MTQLPGKALIFGVTGQDGQHLVRLFDSLGLEWVGVARTGPFVQGDIGDFNFVRQVIAAHSPSYIFHLAADSTTRHDSLMANYSAISTGSLNVLEASREIVPDARIFLSGSALQLQNLGSPIDESAEPSASSAYALARIQSLLAARYFRETFKMRVYFGYFFNHDGEFRSNRHINRAIADAAIRISRGEQRDLVLGDPTVRKEFNYAGDIVRAIWVLVNQDGVYEAVLGNGEDHSIQEWADVCFAKVGLRAADHIRTDGAFTSEYRILVSNPKLIKSLGWSPAVSFRGLADIMMADL